MPYMERQFHATTGIQLMGLSDFMGWIKWGSYYHGVVARKGQLHKCAHLVGVELPRWPQITPSESCQVSQRREGTPGDLLPPIEDYLVGGEFQGSRDVRVVERAKTLRIAAWLHHLDMATDGMRQPLCLWRPPSMEGGLFWSCS